MTKNAQIALDTDPGGRSDVFSLAELLPAAVAACMVKGIERVAPMLHFDFKDVDVHAVRQNSPPKIVSIDYVVTVDSDATEHDRSSGRSGRHVDQAGMIRLRTEDHLLAQNQAGTSVNNA